MIRKHKKTLILTSLLTLLPILVGLLLWDKFPEKMATHYGLTGEADGWSSVPFAVFVPPLLLLAVQWLGIWFTVRDPGNQNRNQKMFTIVLWIVPIISNLCSYLMYALALGMEFNVANATLAAMGILFIVLGNYMPKTRMNATIGIKVPWTYTSEENWNATHRFAGKVWVVGGLLMAFGGFLPDGAAITVMLLAILVLTIVPVVYSWQFYKRELAEGKELKSPFSSTDPKNRKISVLLLILLLVFLGIVLFRGDIEYRFFTNYLVVDPSVYSDNILFYDAIEEIEYREGNVPGLRVGGYGSFRLLLGFFENEEFGTYTRYTYYKPESCVVIHLKNSVWVLSAETKEETEALYQQLLAKIN